jgi:hypothetical protein
MCSKPAPHDPQICIPKKKFIDPHSVLLALWSLSLLQAKNTQAVFGIMTLLPQATGSYMIEIQQIIQI